MGLGALLLLCAELPATPDQCPAILEEPIKKKQFGQLRAKSIKSWDKLITWAFLPKYRPYVLVDPPVEITYKGGEKQVNDFVTNYGYFSIYHPILGIVTDSKKDIEVTQCLLYSIQAEIDNPEQLKFASDEILVKVMAYRTLKKGMKISVPISKEEMVTYVVDEVFDLWRGMPAYGLVPEKGTPILLFRGTDLDLASEKSWASVMSDLDVSGPGLKTFQRAQKEIHDWLVKMQHNPARVVGYSLGGVLTLYTLIYEHEFINQQIPSVAFNPPGVSEQVLEQWEKIPKGKRPPHVIYVNQGDFVSQIGLFLGNVQEISLEQSMDVIQAHVTLISGAPIYKISEVNVPLENQARK
jgi:hypothetical protein